MDTSQEGPEAFDREYNPKRFEASQQGTPPIVKEIEKYLYNISLDNADSQIRTDLSPLQRNCTNCATSPSEYFYAEEIDNATWHSLIQHIPIPSFGPHNFSFHNEHPKKVMILEGEYNSSHYMGWGCKGSSHITPDIKCTMPCTDCQCKNVVTFCQKVEWCDAIAFYGKPKCRSKKNPILLHYLSEQEMETIANAFESMRKKQVDQCLSLGKVSVHYLDGELDMYAEEISRVSALVKEGTAPLLFLHIQKAGGSTLCKMAKANDLRVPKESVLKVDRASITGKNCNPSNAEAAAAWYGSAHWQLAYTRQTKVQFFANEKFLQSSLPWGRMGFITVLRHPLERLVSHFYHFGPNCKPKVPATNFEDFVECSEKNIMVRRLCGCLGDPQLVGCGNATKGMITDLEMTSAHLECAKDRLRRFTVVLIMDALSVAGDLLRERLGWKLADFDKLRSGTSNQISVEDLYKVYPTVKVKMAAHHKLDMELYEYAKILACRSLFLLGKRENHAVPLTTY